MKGINLFPWKANITGLWKPGRREGDQAKVLLPLSEDKAGEHQTLSGFLPCEAQQLPAKSCILCFWSCISRIFLGVSNPWETQLSSWVPEALTHLHSCWIPPLCRVLLWAKLFLQLHQGEFSSFPTPVEPVLPLSPSLSQSYLHLKHTNSSSSTPWIFSDWSSLWFYHLLLRGFFLFVESPQVLVLSLYFSSKSVIEAMGEGFYTKSMYGHA